MEVLLVAGDIVYYVDVRIYLGLVIALDKIRVITLVLLVVM